MPKPSLQLKLGQQLTMTPQLQQAIRLLQLPALELQAHIRELLETNVMLEPDEAEVTGTFEVRVTAAEQPKPPDNAAESTVEVLDEGWGDHSVGPAETPWSSDEDERQQEYADESGKSLQDHLMWQLELASLAPRELAVARAIVDAISDDGYLIESLAEIGHTLWPELECSTEEVHSVLARVQALDPPGVGARSVAECIELQLRQLDPVTPGFDTALQIARQHLELVAQRELTLLRRELRATEEELDAALALVRSCHPRPGATVSANRAQYVVPAVFVRRTDHGWGVEHMRPMILKDIAEAVAMHESTVSRVTSGKYMHTPRGVFELRYFFSSQVEGADGSGTSSTAIRAKIRKLVKEEDADAPLSDGRIAELLSAEGIPVARRTVAKYREAMGIAASNERRRAGLKQM